MFDVVGEAISESKSSHHDLRWWGYELAPDVAYPSVPRRVRLPALERNGRQQNVIKSPYEIGLTCTFMRYLHFLTNTCKRRLRSFSMTPMSTRPGTTRPIRAWSCSSISGNRCVFPPI